MIHAHDLDLVECLYYYYYLKLRNALSYQFDGPIKKLNNNLNQCVEVIFRNNSLYIHLEMICFYLMNGTYLAEDPYQNDDENN